MPQFPNTNTHEPNGIIQTQCPFCDKPARGVEQSADVFSFDCLYCGRAGQVNGSGATVTVTEEFVETRSRAWWNWGKGAA